MKTKKLTLTALLTATALIFGYIESLFPIPMPIPGIKLGLGNIVIMIAIYSLNNKIALAVMLAKVFVSAMLFASPAALIYSFSGGIASLIIMIIMKKFEFNVVCTGMGGGIAHNMGQLICAALILNNINFFYYLPVLIISGSIVGAIVGVISKIVCKNISSVL